MKSGPTIPSISVEGLKALYDSNTSFILLDVREEDEYRIATITGSILIPLSKISQEGLSALPETVHSSQKVIVHCHHGGRSSQVVQWLLQEGFNNVSNLEGGIDAWSLRIDSKIPRY